MVSRRGDEGERDTNRSLSEYSCHTVTGQTGLAPKAGKGTGAVYTAACLVFVHFMASRIPFFEGQTSCQVVCLTGSNSANDGGARLDTRRYPR